MPALEEMTTAFRVTFDDLTLARLLELAETCHAHPAQVISAIVKDVLEDDWIAHNQPLPLN